MSLNRRKGTGFLSRMPIKFKLTLWSTVLIMVLFVSYDTLQYLVMEKWIIQRERDNVQRNMSEILNYFLEREADFGPEQLKSIKQYLDKANRDDQMIRIVGADNVPLITATHDVPEGWLQPLSVSEQQLEIYRSDGRSYVLMRSPLTIFEFTGTVEIVKSLAVFEDLIRTIQQVTLLFAAGAVALSFPIGWLISRKLLKPLQAMTQTIRDVTGKGMQERMVPAGNGDELSTLMIQFNDMMDRVEEAFRQQSRFVEDASHELRTPIAIIEGHLALLRRWGKDDAAVLDESLASSLQEFARLKGLVTELLLLTRAEKETGAHAEPLANPEAAVRDIAERFMSLHPDFALTLDLAALRGARLAVPGEHLEQMLRILLDNAVKYSHRDKAIHVAAALDGGAAALAITDRGIGIPADDLPYITERFYRVDKARSRNQGGNGLGLAIAKRLVERYNGKLTLHSREHLGTTATIRLPCAPANKPLQSGSG